VALKVCRDEAGEGGPRYVYVSSTGHGGPSPGSQVHAPLGTLAGAELVRLTEGELKADGPLPPNPNPTLTASQKEAAAGQYAAALAGFLRLLAPRHGAVRQWLPAFLVTAPLAELIRSNRAGRIDLLARPDRLERCPACRWPQDSARRCPKCFDRLGVDCGKPTRSYFIMRCVVCGHVHRG
jgi:hypothetical protein